MGVLITGIAPDSPASRAGINPGETLVSVNGRPVRDLMDYRFFTTEPLVELELTSQEVSRTVSVRKSAYSELGLLFETYLMDKHKGCQNACVFCFIDQLPKGLRKSLYFKDDDERLSFLFGNYITLTNLSDEEAARICEMRLSPVNISVHTTNPALRVQMMRNPEAGKSLKYIDLFDKAGIEMNFQIVLVPGLNDRSALTKTLTDLAAKEHTTSIAVVPVGLTAHRQKLYHLQAIDRQSALETVRQVEAFGEKTLKKRGLRLAVCADEFYLKAGLTLPPYEFYEDFPQLENGVGMMTYFEHDFLETIDQISQTTPMPRYLIATGEAASGHLSRLVDRFNRQYGTSHLVRGVNNLLMGGGVTVAGLLSGSDIAAGIGNRSGSGYGALLLPSSMLRSGEPVFLDDTTPEWLSEQVGLPVRVIEPDGAGFAYVLAGKE